VRDTLEFALIKKAMLLELPVLGICRGEQILNVAFGGSLIVDIPEDYDAKHLHRCDDPAECFHPVEIVNGSNLFRLTRLKKGMVNTNHHQAIDELADEFAKTAVSPGGIIEAIEWKDAIGEPFLIAVQWHPERMEQDNPLSYKIGEAFIKEAKEFQEKSCD
jgi:putative glutamine amidotransferase